MSKIMGQTIVQTSSAPITSFLNNYENIYCASTTLLFLARNMAQKLWHLLNTRFFINQKIALRKSVDLLVVRLKG